VALINTSEDNLIIFHLSLAKNIREQFGMWEGNTDLLASCEESNPDDASMVVIVKAVLKELNQRY